MFTNVKPASGPLQMENIGLQSERKHGGWSGNAPSSCHAASLTPPPDITVLLSAASSAGREPELITSAVQRSFLDRFGHGSAKESDDGTRVVTAYHSAARHNHVGSGLTQRRNKKIFISKKQVELFAWRISESLTSAHLWMVSGPTPPSTSMSKDGNWLLNQLTWVTPETRKTLSTKLLIQREGSRESISLG